MSILETLRDTAVELGFSSVDYGVLAINLLLFLFSRRIVRGFPTEPDSDEARQRLTTLHLINLLLFLLYFVAAVVHDLARQISRTGLTLLVAYLSLHFLNVFILRRYGRVRVIDGTEYRSETYQSEVFSLLAMAVVATGAFLSVINIWGMTDWLRTTSVIGGLLVLLFSTREAWAPDNIHGLILLYNRDVVPGAVVRVPELDLTATVIQTTLTQTVLKDLVQGHRILVPNARLRGAKVEVLSEATAAGLWESTDFQIGYGLDGDEVVDLLTEVWRRACGDERALDGDRAPRVVIADNGDHAVRWRLFYLVSSPYRLMPARYAVNRAAYDLSQERGVGLNTPLTHELLASPESRAAAPWPPPAADDAPEAGPEAGRDDA